MKLGIKTPKCMWKSVGASNFKGRPRKAKAKKNIKDRVGTDGRWLIRVVLLLLWFSVYAFH